MATDTAHPWEAWQLARCAVQDPAHPDALAHLALRHRSRTVLNALALAASNNRVGAVELAHRALAGTMPAPLMRSASAPSAAAFALAIGGMGRSEADVQVAAAIYRVLVQRPGWARLAKAHHVAAAQTLFLTGQRSALRDALPLLDQIPRPILRYVHTDLLHPYLEQSSDRGSGVTPSTAEHQAWEQALSQVFVDSGLPGITVRDSGGPAQHLFDRLTGATDGSASASADGPMVTVIMPTYQPDEGLLTSIASIAAQTWANIEILLVDDASGPGDQAWFDQAVALDPRIRLIRMPRNGGSYLARNAAMQQAAGEFITIQDADDWSHPRRIEDQARLLLEHPNAAASRSRAVRARDDLTHQWYGYSAVRDNASSLMVRRDTWDRVGPFAAIRKGADSEYAERITTLAGPIADTRSVLAVTRLRSGSLSRGDFSFNWTHPDRLIFRGLYRALHRRATNARQGGTVVPVLTDEGRLPVPVPTSFLRGLPGATPRTRYAVGYLADLSADPTESAHAAATIRERPSPDADPVALWHLESPVWTTGASPVVGRVASHREIHPVWFDRAAAGQVVPVSRLDPINISTLIVSDPAVLVLAADQPPEIRVEEVVIRLGAELLASEGAGAGHGGESLAAGWNIDLLSAADVCRQWWGIQPRWVIDDNLTPEQRHAVHARAGSLIDEPAGGDPSPRREAAG